MKGSLPCKKRAKKSAEFRKIPGILHFFAHNEKPGKLGVSSLSRKAWSLLAFHTFPESMESQETPHFPGFSKIPLFPGKPGILPPKPGKPRRNALSFPGFPLCAKKRGKPGTIPRFPGFPGLPSFLESMEHQPEHIGQQFRTVPSMIIEILVLLNFEDEEERS